jgi:hypothetical protein
MDIWVAPAFQRILDELFDHRGRTFDDLTGGDAGDKSLVEELYSHIIPPSPAWRTQQQLFDAHALEGHDGFHVAAHGMGR